MQTISTAKHAVLGTAAVLVWVAAGLSNNVAMAQMVTTLERRNLGAPGASFSGGRLIASSGDFGGGDVFGMFLQTQAPWISDKLATLSVQTSMVAQNHYANIFDVGPGGRFYNRPWTLNVKIFDVNLFDPLNPNSSLLSSQAVSHSTPTPLRVGEYFASSTTVFELVYNAISLPHLEAGAAPRGLLIAFSPELGLGNDQTRFFMPYSNLSTNSPTYLAEGTTDLAYTCGIGIPFTIGLWASPSGRIPLSFQVSTVPGPSAALVAGSAVAFVAGSRRRR